MTKRSAPGAVWVSFFLYLLTAIWPLVIAPFVVVFALEPTQGGDRQVGMANAVAAGVSAAVAIAQIVIVFLMRAGHRWARILLVVLTAVSALGLSFGGVSVGFVGLFGIGVTFVTVIAALLMFTPAANRYFRKQP